MRATFVLVQLLQAALVGLKDDTKAVPGRPLDSGLAATGQHEERPTRRCARWRDVGAPAVGDHRLTLQQPPQQGQLLVGEPSPQTHVDPEVRVLLRAMADAERV